MANVNQSTASPKAFPAQPGDSGMRLGSCHSRKAPWHQTAVLMAAWLEIIVGISFLFLPNIQSQFLFGVIPEGVGVPFARFAGIGLIGLGIACLPSKLEGTRHGAVRGLFIFNIGATIFFAWVGAATAFHGVMLWPVVINRPLRLHFASDFGRCIAS